MGLFMDADGIPLAFSMFPGNQNEQPSLVSLEKKVISDFGIDKLVVCTDSSLSSTANMRFNDTKRSANDYKRLLSEEHITRHGEAAEKSLIDLDTKKIAEEEQYDGLYAVCTNLDDNVEAIVRINHKHREIEECFHIMKTEFKARPVYLSREDRIKAHFLTCYASLVLYRILEKRLAEKFPETNFSCHEIIQTLRNMNMMISPGMVTFLFMKEQTLQMLYMKFQASELILKSFQTEI